MKCAYHPLEDAEERCTICNITLCKNCHAESELNEGMCHSCRRQQKIGKMYTYIRYGVWGLGIAWAIVAIIIFYGKKTWIDIILYASIGIAGVILVNFLVAFILSRMLLSDLEPHQKVFVALSRYSITGNKIFFTQALNSMKKVDDMSLYRDALMDHLISILILQPYDLPEDWLGYLSENFKLTEEEILQGMITFGLDMFEDNIFVQHHYQAMELYIDILKRTNSDDIYNKLIDRILKEIVKVDLKAVNKKAPPRIPGVDPTQQPQREDPSIVRHRAFLTEISMLDAELEEFLIAQKREKDFNKIKDIIDNFELPDVPKNTLAAARALLPTQQGYQAQGPDQIAGTADDALEVPKVKACAECEQTFNKDDMLSYVYNDVKVSVCTDCAVLLEKEGHREPKLLAELNKSKKSKK